MKIGAGNMAKQLNLRLNEALLKEIEELSQYEHLDRAVLLKKS